MDKLKPFEKLAGEFQISNESAKYFPGRVPKSFRQDKPPHKLILDFIETQKLETLPTPYEIAALLNERGLWAHTLNSAPPISVDDDEEGPDIFLQPPIE
jgi:hypothetical protein